MAFRRLISCCWKIPFLRSNAWQANSIKSDLDVSGYSLINYSSFKWVQTGVEMNQLCDSDNLHRIDYFIQRETFAKNKGNLRSKIWVSKWNWETYLNSWKCDYYAGLNYRKEADTGSDDTRNRRIDQSN